MTAEGPRGEAEAPRGTVWAVVPAAGQGERMGAKKQDLRLGGRSLLHLTLGVFEATPAVTGVVVAVPPEDVAAWRRRLARLSKVRAVVAGGAVRQESVAQGLAALPEEAALVVVHDGVRPFVTPPLIEAVIAEARASGAATAGLPLTETVKRGLDGWVKETVEREGLFTIQTPQAFRVGLLVEAHARARAEGFSGTDDAVLVERLGHPVRLVPGLPTNLKITRPEELELARALLRRLGRSGVHP